jgi:hypothetical protein
MGNDIYPFLGRRVEFCLFDHIHLFRFLHEKRRDLLAPPFSAHNPGGLLG